MQKLTLNIYDDNGELVRVAEGASAPRIRYGVVRSIFELLKISDDTTTFDVLQSVYGAWEEVQGLLGNVFPDVTNEEWDNVDLSDIVTLLFSIVKAIILKMNDIPTDPKNLTGA